MKLAPRVAVVGESDASKMITLEAEDVGREIALRGGTLICGGLGGVMEAAARGCKSAGGITIGIIRVQMRRMQTLT